MSYGPPSGDAPPPAQTDTKAVIALVLAIVAYTGVPFIAAIVALFLARSARQDILASGGTRTGLGLCTAATVISWIHLALVALLFVGFLLLLAVGFS